MVLPDKFSVFTILSRAKINHWFKYHKRKILLNGKAKSLAVFIVLTILNGITCALLNSVQKFIEIGWLLLKYFICLRN